MSRVVGSGVQRAILASLVVALCVVGCEDKPPPPASPGSPRADNPRLAPKTSAPDPQPARAHDAATGNAGAAAMPRDPSPAGVAAPPAAAPARLEFDVAADWKSTPPTNAMRLAQYVLPRAEGDSEDGELVFYGGIGGSAAANLDRWKSQVTLSDGSSLPAEAYKSETFDVSGIKVTTLDAAGRYMATAMGGPGPAPKENYRMIGAVVESAGSVWFFKAAGPSATMAKHADALMKAFRTVRLAARP